ncbi:MAG: AMIN domain-containing protein, partial [Proteobacteria bacterium]|nr:AMIN domain-containing protein [Pseudomonadota bacterium]
MIRQPTRLRRHLWLAGAAFVVALSATLSHARGSIESVSGFLQGGSEVLRIEFSEPQTELPTGFAVQTPARIALDFPGTTNASGRSVVEINQGNVKSANIVEAGERSRIVLNL